MQLAKVKLSFSVLNHFVLLMACNKIGMFAELTRNISRGWFPLKQNLKKHT